MPNGRGFSQRPGGGQGLGGGGGGRGRQPGGFGLGSEGEYICPSCGAKTPHQRGIPCYEHRCPKCGAQMTRRR